MIKWLTKILLVAGIFSVSLFSSSVFAAGIGVHPQALEVNQAAEQESQTEIFVYNTTGEPALYQVYPDNYSSLLRINSEKFRLEGGESRGIVLTVKSFPPGTYSTNLSVVAEELSDEASLPKTGVKIPVNINIAQSGELGINRYLLPVIIGLFLLALILFLVSSQRYGRASTIHKVEDLVEEQFARRAYKNILKHYFKHHQLVLVSIIAILIAFGLLIWSFIPISWQSQPVAEGEVRGIVLELQSPEGKSLYRLSPQSSLTPFSALDLLANDYGIPFTYDPPQEFGVFVTSIGAYQNGIDGRYWVYEINNKPVPLAADRIQLQSDDRLIWKFETPSESFDQEE